MKKIICFGFWIISLAFVLLVTYHLSLITVYAQSSCDQGCFDRLEQCQNNDCQNRPPGSSRDNCINDCVQAKDRCIASCHGRPPTGACHTPSQSILDIPSLELQGSNKVNAVFTWHAGDEGNQGGCDGRGRKYIVLIGTCPENTTVYSASICSEAVASDLLPEATYSKVLENKKTYWWQVRSICNCGAESLSAPEVFVANPFACNSKSKEEQAVCNQNNYLLPEEVNVYIPEQGIFQQILAVLRRVVANLFFPPPPGNPVRMYAQSGSLDQVTVPDQIKPKTDDFVINFKGFLGNKDGIYCVDLPEQVQASEIKDCEKLREQTNFPGEIRPITP